METCARLREASGTPIDEVLPEIKRLGLEPIALVAWPTYVSGKWMNLNWQKPTDQALADLADQVAALVEHQPYLRGAPPGLPFHWDKTTLLRGLKVTDWMVCEEGR